jgi:hypothetical protein
LLLLARFDPLEYIFFRLIICQKEERSKNWGWKTKDDGRSVFKKKKIITVSEN